MPSARTSGEQWRVIAIVFLILNVALGVNFNGYGSLVAAIQNEFATQRVFASAGLSMLTLSLGLLSPLVGTLMRRVSIRLLMAVGISLNAIGYLVISQVHSIGAMLACYALVVGPGFCLFSVVPCTAIIANWFDTGRGRALGIINMPVGSSLMPIAAAVTLGALGLRATFVGGALILLALLPLLLLLRDKPRLPTSTAPVAVPSAVPPLPSRAILRSPAFLILSLGIGILSAGGLVMVTHLVALGMTRGLDLGTSSLLLAAFGVAGVVGAPAFGWIADRIGPRYALALLCFASIPPWIGLIVSGSSFVVLLALAIWIGACSNAIMTLFGLAMSDWLGESNLGLAMGLSYSLQIPFMFGAGPLAGAMFDHYASYTPTIVLHCTSFAVMGVIFLLFRRGRASARPASAVS
jgi:MFS family permease